MQVKLVEADLRERLAVQIELSPAYREYVILCLRSGSGPTLYDTEMLKTQRQDGYKDHQNKTWGSVYSLRVVAFYVCFA